MNDKFIAKQREKLTKELNEDLKHIPRGNSVQNTLREIYTRYKISDFWKHPERTKAETIRRAVETVKEIYPNADVFYDKEYFKE